MNEETSRAVPRTSPCHRWGALAAAFALLAVSPAARADLCGDTVDIRFAQFPTSVTTVVQCPGVELPCAGPDLGLIGGCRFSVDVDGDTVRVADFTLADYGTGATVTVRELDPQACFGAGTGTVAGVAVTNGNTAGYEPTATFTDDSVTVSLADGVTRWNPGDFVELSMEFEDECEGDCSEVLLVPYFLSNKNDPSGTNTLFAVRNLTAETRSAEVEYLAVGGAQETSDSLTLGPHETRTVSLRDVSGLSVDPDGFARGFVRILTPSGPGGAPPLAGDFFQVDVANNFATGDRLVRQVELCVAPSIRFVDFGAPTRFTVYVTQPRGEDRATDPPSFTVQALDEAGLPDGAPQSFWTAEHALEIESADLTGLDFGTARFDFANSLGGAAYAEYRAGGRFSVGVVSQCPDAPSCDESDCCPPGSPTAVAAGLHYPKDAGFPDCEAAMADAVASLGSFHYRNACQETHGGPLPDAVLGARVVDCQVDPPQSEGNVVVAVEACCPLH